MSRQTVLLERRSALAAVESLLRRTMMRDVKRPIVLGVCGAQGSGKSTLSSALADRMTAAGVATAVLSIDDIYLAKAQRAALARDVHPLFAVRGVPGTHEVKLGLGIIAALDDGREVALPRFDKAHDTRLPEAAWDMAAADTELLILEGWFVGARPEPEAALLEPVNDLERFEDAAGRWRRAANAALAGEYQSLFARIDMLVLLAAPSFEIVQDWRIEQEHSLAKSAGAEESAIMSDAQVRRFVLFYERLTRHILAEMPGRADLVIRLDEYRKPLSVAGRAVAASPTRRHVREANHRMWPASTLLANETNMVGAKSGEPLF